MSPKEALKEDWVTPWQREPHFGTQSLTFSTSTLTAAVKRVRRARVTGCREKSKTMMILGNQNVSLVFYQTWSLNTCHKFKLLTKVRLMTWQGYSVMQDWSGFSGQGSRVSQALSQSRGFLNWDVVWSIGRKWLVSKLCKHGDTLTAINIFWMYIFGLIFQNGGLRITSQCDFICKIDHPLSN